MESTTPYLLRFGLEGVHDIDMRGKTDAQILTVLEANKTSTAREVFAVASASADEYIKKRHEDLICEVDRVFTDATSREFTKSLFAAIKRDPKRIGIIMKCVGPGADKVWEIFVYMLTHGDADFGRHSASFSNGMIVEDCTHRQSLVLWLDLLFLVIGERFSAALDELEEKRGIRWAQYRHHPWSFQHFHEINKSEAQRAIPAKPVQEDVPEPTEGDAMPPKAPDLTKKELQVLFLKLPEGDRAFMLDCLKAADPIGEKNAGMIKKGKLPSSLVPGLPATVDAGFSRVTTTGMYLILPEWRPLIAPAKAGAFNDLVGAPIPSGAEPNAASNVPPTPADPVSAPLTVEEATQALPYLAPTNLLGTLVAILQSANSEKPFDFPNDFAMEDLETLAAFGWVESGVMVVCAKRADFIPFAKAGLFDGLVETKPDATASDVDIAQISEAEARAAIDRGDGSRPWEAGFTRPPLIRKTSDPLVIRFGPVISDAEATNMWTQAATDDVAVNGEPQFTAVPTPEPDPDEHDGMILCEAEGGAEFWLTWADIQNLWDLSSPEADHRIAFIGLDLQGINVNDNELANTLLRTGIPAFAPSGLIEISFTIKHPIS